MLSGAGLWYNSDVLRRPGGRGEEELHAEFYPEGPRGI